MIDYEQLYEEVKNKLSPTRFKHSEGVVERALEYADRYNVDKNIVKLVAIAHDIAKELSEEEIACYIGKGKVTLDNIEKINSNLVHAKIGAYICKNKYNFTQDMVDAISYHTTGRENMSILEKIIYLADATDKNRKYIDIDYYVNLTLNNIDRAIYEVAKWNIAKLVSSNKIIHLDTIKCYNYYIEKER